MTKQLWSVNALATELELDRRTVARRLNGLEPAKVEGQSRLYYLSDVLPILNFSDHELREARLPLVREAAVKDLLRCAEQFFLAVHDRSLRILAALLKERTGWPAAECWNLIGHFFAVTLQLAEETLKSEINIDLERYEFLAKMSSKEGQAELNRWLEKLDTDCFSPDYIEKEFQKHG